MDRPDDGDLLATCYNIGDARLMAAAPELVRQCLALLDRAEAAERELAWFVDNYGTRTEIEARVAEAEAKMAAVEAMSDAEIDAVLRAEGVDPKDCGKRLSVLRIVLDLHEKMALANARAEAAERDRDAARRQGAEDA